MQKFIKPHTSTLKGIAKKLVVWALLVTMTVQAFTVGAFAAPIFPSTGSGSTSGNMSPSGIGRIDDESLMADLKSDYLSYIKDDLLMKIEDYELRGEVDVVLTFSENSIIESYLASGDTASKTFNEYRISDKAAELEKALIKNQEAVLDTLLEKGLISHVYHTYTNLLDGAFVSTTYEQIDELYDIASVQRVTLSNTYKPMTAVENPVNVYDTGIFNSGNVSFTGKGTVVAVLDTGCDYTHTAFTSHAVQDPKYDRDDIAQFLPLLRANSYGDPLEAREVYYGNITNGKIVYGYDYADKDPDIMPYSNSHGTHVAGIIGGSDETITGVAIDTQFAIMKVFSDYKEGAKDGDIIAALEDSVVLSVDAINMSLGTSCGFTVEREADELYKNELYERIEKAGISLVVAASNDYSSAMGGESGNTNKTDNPDSATVGAPSTYPSAMSVASINGNKDYYMHANGDHTVFFTESFDMAQNEYDFFEMLGIKEGETVTYEYVTVPGLGLAINYSGIDVKNKIALVKRGDISFEEKVQYAQEAGAIAVIIYNNVFGDITMTIGNYAKIPAVSIGKDDGDILAAQPTGTIVFDRSNVAGPFMSGFSSWGPAPDLTLKPDITAHGGNIKSAVIGGYDELSGTSMAAPNMCGITVLIRQYVKDKYPELTTVEVRDLVNQLCMSTATIANDKNGNPYSPRKQGAGIADIVKSTTTEAYLYVDGLNKTKLELGADPKRTGVYDMVINLKNLSTTGAVSYVLGHIAMTESVSTSDIEYVSEMAYLLNSSAEYSVEGGTIDNGIVTVEAGKTAKIKVKITLSPEDKSYIDTLFANGMYVEGFLTFDNTDENGVDLNAPFLAFYGDWGEAPLFDLDYYEVETEAHNDAIDDEDKIKADYYATTPLANYYYDYIIPLGTYLFKMDESEYTEIPATQEHAAISYYADSLSGLYGTFVGLLRNARELNVKIVNTTTGEVIYDVTEYNCYKAHYGGAPRPYVSKVDLKGVDAETNEVLGWNNNKFEVTLSAKLDWDGGDNLSDTYSYSFYIDYEAPIVTASEFRTEYDKGREENRYYLDIMVYDNHYAMSCRPVAVYNLFYPEEGENGEMKRTTSSLCDLPIPVYQENRGEATLVTIEITDYLDIIAESDMPSGVCLYLDDYALNTSLYYIPFPKTDDGDIEFLQDEIDLDINQTFDLTKFFVEKDTTTAVESDYLSNLKWSSSDESVVTVKNGKIEALKSGSAVISATSASWDIKELVGEEVVKTPVYKSIVINVSDQVVDDDPDSGKNVDIEDLTFAYYNTLFAFTNYIDGSAIGRTGSINYFGGNYSIEFYPSEQIELIPQLKPWNISKDRYEFTWTTSNPNVASVDQNGVVTAEAEGKARITLQIKIDGKTSLMAARLSVEVKSEFIIENRKLVAYKGKGGDVVIPDDEGIMFIGSYAFSHFYLNNKLEVEKDEDGYYDMDLKKTPIGNDTITSVVIPENVETIEKHAFYNCSALTKVTLPESCETIGSSAFEKCEALVNINLDNVDIISDRAFYGCIKLDCSGIGGVNLSGVYTIGDYAFAKTALTSVTLSYLSRVGVGIFSECSGLTEVELGKRTRISVKMFENTPVKNLVIYSDVVSDEAFSGCKELESVVLKNDVTYIGKSAFAGCSKLSSVTFEGNVESMSDSVFSGCTDLSGITLPDCDIVLGSSVFSGSGIKNVVFSENTKIVSAGNAIFEKISSLNVDLSKSENYKLVGTTIYSKDGKELVMMLPSRNTTSVTVPKEVEKIADGAFSSVSTLISVKFVEGSKLKTIGKYAFANCDTLISVTLPENEITVEDYAFYSASALKTIDLKSVVYVGTSAFEETLITEVNLVADNVHVGSLAFNGCSKLTRVSLGKNAYIGEKAFARSAVTSVELAGDAEISAYAFYECARLSSFDFADVTGKIGDYAFMGCSKLSAVVAPNVTEIGNATFANCSSLTTLTANKLTTVGEQAFALVGNETSLSNHLGTINLPALETAGNGAFYASLYLTSAELPALKTIGTSAFASCLNLKKITYSDELTEIPASAFYYCLVLEEIDLSKIVTIGDLAFYGVNLHADLVLESVETIGAMAFVGLSDKNNINEVLVSVTAPKLKKIGDRAFYGCINLKTLNAPVLEEIGQYAFYKTVIEEIEISSAFKKLDLYAFEGSTTLKTFFAVVDGQKVYDIDFDNVILRGGVLYTVRDFGYTLTCYPAAKTDTEYTVVDGTLRLEIGAFMYNTSIEKVTLPASLKYIANYAFFKCDSLDTVVFNSYYAPVLEGTYNGERIDINPSTIEKFTGFDTLYKYDYYYAKEGTVIRALYYRNFVGTVGTNEVPELTAILPDNCEGYDSLLYTAYFTVSEETSGETMGKFAIAFIEAVNKLPLNIDRFDKIYIDNAIVAYNAIKNKDNEMAYVSDDVFEKFFKLRSDYNVDVVTDKIAHIFDVFATQHSFDTIKDARAAYLALSDEEKARIENAKVLDEKIAELSTVLGTEINFDLNYEDHVTEPDIPNDDPAGPPTPPAEKKMDLTLIIIIASAVVVVAAVTIVVAVFLKKKKAASEISKAIEQKIEAESVENEEVSEEEASNDEEKSND